MDLVNQIRSAAMNCLLKNTKHKRFFTQEEYEANRHLINEIYRCSDNLQKELNLKNT